MTDRMQMWVAAMREGRYPDAWALAARTLAERDLATCDDPALPYHLRWVWDGQPVDGRDVLVRCYHGLGDTIQFARYLPLLRQRARSVTLDVQPRLIDLLQGVTAGVEVAPFDPARPLRPREVNLDITELDLALRAAPRDVSVPYIHSPAAPLPTGTIALCYGAGDWDQDRCIPPALFANVCHRHPVISLMAEPSDLPVLNPAGCPFDMGETAMLVAGAALVITVDTMIGHLAGAMGKPTWLLLKAEPDWRWCPRSRATPWYPATRLYAQAHAGDWHGVIDRIERDLASPSALAPTLPQESFA